MTTQHSHRLSLSRLRETFVAGSFSKNRLCLRLSGQASGVCRIMRGVNMMRCFAAAGAALVFSFTANAAMADSTSVTMHAVTSDGVGASVGEIHFTDTEHGLLIEPELNGALPGLAWHPCAPKSELRTGRSRWCLWPRLAPLAGTLTRLEQDSIWAPMVMAISVTCLTLLSKQTVWRSWPSWHPM